MGLCAAKSLVSKDLASIIITEACGSQRGRASTRPHFGEGCGRAVGFPLGLHKLHDGIHISRNEGPYSNILLNIARHQHRKREGQDRREITGLIRWLRWCKEKVALLSEREWHIGKAFRASLPCHAGAAGLTQPAGTWKADVCRHHWAGRAVSRVLSECREWLSRLLGINTAGITSRLVVKAAMTGVIGRRLEMAAPGTS